MVNKRSNNNEDNNTSGFLRAEFERISELFLENEKFGENRVNFLISLISAITAILTGIGVLEAFGGKSDSPNITISWFESMFRTGTSDTSLHTIPITLLSIFLYALIITVQKIDNDEVIVNIKDNGIGIDLKVLPKLFTKFATKSKTGTGLGMFISRSIIEAHGGKIWAKNNPDAKGATFTFTLPISQQYN